MQNKTANQVEGEAPQAEGNSHKHPIIQLRDFINKKPLNLIKFESAQEDDGSIKITVRIPSLAEQQKEKALEHYHQTQKGQDPGMVATNDGGVAPAGTQEPGLPARPVAAQRAIMMNKKAARALRSRFPAGFLKGMNLA